MTMNPKKARARLLERRQELNASNEMSAGAREAVTLDQQRVGRVSRIGAMQEQEMAQATERNRAAELVRIGEALKRIEEGDYGACENCGEEIAEKRLEIDPAALLCIRCASG